MCVCTIGACDVEVASLGADEAAEELAELRREHDQQLERLAEERVVELERIASQRGAELCELVHEHQAELVAASHHQARADTEAQAAARALQLASLAQRDEQEAELRCEREASKRELSELHQAVSARDDALREHAHSTADLRQKPLQQRLVYCRSKVPSPFATCRSLRPL